MIALSSDLQGQEKRYADFYRSVRQNNFSLGGNWDYGHGSFDRSLDDNRQVWLRIPFRVTRGEFDGEKEDNDAWIELGTPFVLKHVYNKGLDAEADPKMLGALMDQFQDPVDKDAEVEEKWVKLAQDLMWDVELGLKS